MIRKILKKVVPPGGRDADTARGISNSLKTAFEPEIAAIEQFDDLIAKLSTSPGTTRGSSKARAD